MPTVQAVEVQPPTERAAERTTEPQVGAAKRSSQPGTGRPCSALGDIARLDRVRERVAALPPLFAPAGSALSPRGADTDSQGADPAEFGVEINTWPKWLRNPFRRRAATPVAPVGPPGVTGHFTDIPSGLLVPGVSTDGSGRQIFGRYFDMKATFASTNGGDCSCGEYRQFVKGSFLANGTRLVHNLSSDGSRPLRANLFREDGSRADGTLYGYRNSPSSGSNFLPDQAGGCDFEGNDEPAFRGLNPAVSYEMDLSFYGKLIDTCNANTELDRSDWQVKGTLPASTPAAVPATTPARAGGGGSAPSG